jgi:uncharacterized protein (DUF849 family)
MPPDLARPCVIMVAPNGARRGKNDHPTLPVTAEEVAGDADACRQAGASAMHFHVRDARGAHSLDVDTYRRWLDVLRDRIGDDGIAIQITSEAIGLYSPAEQMAMVRSLRPPAVSLALRELMPDGEDEGEVRAFLRWLVEAGISPQYILYTPDEVRRFHALRREGVIPQKVPFVIFVLGRYVEPGHVTRPADLLPFLAGHDEVCPWSVCAFGRTETPALVAAAALGGHVRVGFENNLEHADGRVAASNAERVAAVAELVRGLGRPLATAADARTLFAEAAR